MAREPLQDRSRRTLERIMDAAEAELNDKSWLDVTVVDIVRRAQSSVGSFYARFDGKEDLLPRLSSRLSDDIAAAFEQLSAVSAGMSGAAFVERTILELIRFHHRRRGLIRALTLVPRLHLAPPLRSDGLRNADVFASLAGRLAEFTDNPARASLGLFTISMTIREVMIFPEIAGPLVSMTQEQLATELSNMLISYLEG